MIQQLIRRIGAMPLLALPILAALCLTACTDEEGADRAAEAARTITFAANVSRLGDGNADTDVAGTRSTIEGTFAEGDLIGVAIGGVIKPYKYAADGRFVPEEADNGHYWQGNSQEEEAEIIAYYPYNDGELQYLQPADQSSTEKLEAADILTARAKIKRGQTGPITFVHQPARIVINLRAGINMDNESLKTAVLTLPQVELQKVTIDPAAGSITPEGAPAKDGIAPCELATPTKGYCRTAEALCSSQTYAAGTELFRIVVAGKTYPYHLPADKTLDVNTRYTYNVKVNDNDITVTTTADDIPWENTEALPPGYDLTIANEAQLRNFAEAVNNGETINGKPANKAIVLQTADIKLTKEWTPIGNENSGYAFEGKYNGNGHTIENLKITETSAYQHYGLFGYTSGAVLTGINLQNVTINLTFKPFESAYYGGSIVGEAHYSTISLCSATGLIYMDATNMCVGGITGKTHTSTISRCKSEVKITANNSMLSFIYSGGIVGYNEYGIILSCEAQGGAITAESGSNPNYVMDINTAYLSIAGGIVGVNQNGSIAFCRVGENAVEAKNSRDETIAGGLVGYNYSYSNLDLYSCYTRAKVKAESYKGRVKAGAIVGIHGTINAGNCYATSDNTSDFSVMPDQIVYNPKPAPDAIFNLIRGFKDEVESLTYANVNYYPYTTRYDPSATPAYGIEPIRVTWTSAAWKMGIDPIYPEIDMLYGGIPNPDNRANN